MPEGTCGLRSIPSTLQWRETQWKEYLQTVARLYAQDPVFSGYIFDDSFSIGPIGGIGGSGGPASDRFISYSEDDRLRFGKALPKRPSDPAWEAWTQARAGWWEEWARDTNRLHPRGRQGYFA